MIGVECFSGEVTGCSKRNTGVVELTREGLMFGARDSLDQISMWH